MIFSDSHEFLAVLEQTLREQAERNGRSQDYTNLKEELAIERFLARIDPEVAIVKGGTAAMLTLSNTPHTKDVDLVITDKVVQSFALDKMNPAQRADALAELVQDHLRKAPKSDFFRFKLETAFPITDLKPGHACARINISVMVGKSEIHFLQVDIALQDTEIPSKLLPGRDLLGFAEVSNPQIRTVTPEYLVADKVTLYLEEHGTADADRVKDIVHAALIIQSCSLEKVHLTKLLADRAVHREVVDKLRLPVPDPPDRWNDRFDELIEQANTNMTMREAINIIKEKINEIRIEAVTLAAKFP